MSAEPEQDYRISNRVREVCFVSGRWFESWIGDQRRSGWDVVELLLPPTRKYEIPASELALASGIAGKQIAVAACVLHSPRSAAISGGAPTKALYYCKVVYKKDDASYGSTDGLASEVLPMELREKYGSISS